MGLRERTGTLLLQVGQGVSATVVVVEVVPVSIVETVEVVGTDPLVVAEGFAAGEVIAMPAVSVGGLHVAGTVAVDRLGVGGLLIDGRRVDWAGVDGNADAEADSHVDSLGLGGGSSHHNRACHQANRHHSCDHRLYVCDFHDQPPYFTCKNTGWFGCVVRNLSRDPGCGYMLEEAVVMGWKR
jgi:hypothetical protein